MSSVYPSTYTTMTRTYDKFNTSQLTTAREMFVGCSDLKAAPSFNPFNVTDGYHMFYDCSLLTTVGYFNTSKMTTMQTMFYGCINLPSTFPWVIDLASVDKVTDLYLMFYSSGVKTVRVKNINANLKKSAQQYVSGATYIGGMKVVMFNASASDTAYSIIET